MKNNRRQFIKNSLFCGILGFFAPSLISKEINKPKFDYGYYPISKIPNFKFNFTNSRIFYDDNTYTYIFQNLTEQKIFKYKLRDFAIYLVTKNEEIKIRNFDVNWLGNNKLVEYQIA